MDETIKTNHAPTHKLLIDSCIDVFCLSCLSCLSCLDDDANSSVLKTLI